MESEPRDKLEAGPFSPGMFWEKDKKGIGIESPVTISVSGVCTQFTLRDWRPLKTVEQLCDPNAAEAESASL